MALSICSIALAQEKENPDTTVRLNQYGVKVSRHPLLAEERDGILVFESKNKDYKFWLDNRLELDGYIFSKNTFNPIGNGVMLRRTRFAVKADLPMGFYGEVDMNIANSKLEMEDAYIGYNGIKNFAIKAGNFKEGFSMEETTTSRYVPFMERPMIVSAFAPGRTIGIQAAYQYKWLLAIGGVHFNAVGDPEETDSTQTRNKGWGTNEGYSLTGRLVFTPLCTTEYGLHFGGATSFRTPKTSDVDGLKVTRYSTRSESGVNRKKYLDTGKKILTNTHHNLLLNAEFAGYYKGLRWQGEYIQTTTKRDLTTNEKAGKTPDKYTFNGFYAQAGYVLFGGRQQYDRSAGEFTQPSRGKKWGDIELMARYDFINMNDQNCYGGSASGTTFGINYYVSNNVKIVFNYGYMNHDRYATGNGKLFVGHDASGALTTDYTKVVEAKGKAGEKYSQFGLRFEIDF